MLSNLVLVVHMGILQRISSFQILYTIMPVLSRVVSKGGKTVILINVNHIRPLAYIPGQNLHRNPLGWTVMGNSEVNNIMKDWNTSIQGEGEDRKIFKDSPHSTFGNYFSEEKVTDWLGSEGFGGTFSCRRDRLPPDIPAWHLQKKLMLLTKKLMGYFILLWQLKMLRWRNKQQHVVMERKLRLSLRRLASGGIFISSPPLRATSVLSMHSTSVPQIPWSEQRRSLNSSAFGA